MICFTDHPTIVPNAQVPMPKAIIIESAVNQERIKGTEKASPMHTLFHR